MKKQLMKGNEAIVKSAILAGCRAFYGYPITPASEITEAAAEFMPKTGGVFLQAESEVAAINMLYGAASAGVRAMTASSGPGISLMQEGISYMAGAELPCVIADITRGGPGLGNIGAEQGDYHQVVKGGGHGNYRTIVLAPHSVQEMADLTALAFELADRYRNPVVLMADGFIGQMMEPVEFPQAATPTHLPAWAVAGTAASRRNLITSLHLISTDWKSTFCKLEAKYKFAEQREARAEEWCTGDAEIVLVGYGIVGRILKAVTAEARAAGLKVGVLRPITLYPFPKVQFQRLAFNARLFVVVEMSNGQMLEDVRLALNGARPVEFLNRMGGNVPSHEEVLRFVQELARREGLEQATDCGRGADGPCLVERLQSTKSRTARPNRSTRATSARESCSTRRIFVPAAATASCTRCWRRPSTSWACRTGRFWSARWAARSLRTTTSMWATCRRRTDARPRWPRPSSAAARRASSSATRATAIFRPSARRRFCTPPIAAKTSP